MGVKVAGLSLPHRVVFARSMLMDATRNASPGEVVLKTTEADFIVAVLDGVIDRIVENDDGPKI